MPLLNEKKQNAENCVYLNMIITHIHVYFICLYKHEESKKNVLLVWDTFVQREYLGDGNGEG